jgi:hypothetical protein
MAVLHRATPERLSAFSDGVFAVPRSELSVHRDRVDQSSLSDALCHRGDPSPVVAQFRTFVFHVVASTLNRLDGREQIGAATSCFLGSGFLPRERHLHMPYLGARSSKAC